MEDSKLIMDQKEANGLCALLRMELRTRISAHVVQTSKFRKMVITTAASKPLDREAFLYIKDYAEENGWSFDEEVYTGVYGGEFYYYNITAEDQSLLKI